MDINVIGVPLFFGCDREGVNLSPNILRNKGLIDTLKSNHRVYDLGDLHVPEKPSDKFSSHDNMKYFKEIQEVNSNLAQSVYCSLNSGFFPLIIGGDHALGLGSICGVSKFFSPDNFAVIWIDAHGDINTPQSSPSGNVHGMPLAAAMGIGHDDMTNLFFQGRKVNPDNVYIIGARDLDKGELNLIKDLHLKVWTTEEVKAIGVASLIDEILRDLSKKGINNIHLSYDIDSLDKSLVPGTGTPVEEGLDLKTIEDILCSLLKTQLVKSMDFVELNSSLDFNNKTLKVALQLFETISSSLK